MKGIRFVFFLRIMIILVVMKYWDRGSKHVTIAIGRVVVGVVETGKDRHKINEVKRMEKESTSAERSTQNVHAG